MSTRSAHMCILRRRLRWLTKQLAERVQKGEQAEPSTKMIEQEVAALTWAIGELTVKQP